ncbi:hypothetical protein C8Q74DRAFT_459762 [Fomes fomentarius]|nr:hypothetical protein C8Q74DRAFT_459762 [Fomes fomentarius]
MQVRWRLVGMPMLSHPAVPRVPWAAFACRSHSRSRRLIARRRSCPRPLLLRVCVHSHKSLGAGFPWRVQSPSLLPFACLHIPNHRLRSRSPFDSPSLLAVPHFLSTPFAAPMSDDARSVNTKKVGRRPQPRRVLVVSNRSSSDEDVGHPTPEPRTIYQNHPPRPLPVPSRPTPSTEHFPHARNESGPNSNIMPTPLLTNSLYRSPRSVHSNPSSPSSASSPAVESTPPPSTPGLSTIQVNEEGTGTFRQEMFTPMVAKDRHENTAQTSRLRQFVRSQAPAQSHERRCSSSGSRPATSPTVSTSDPYLPTPPHVYRSNPMEKVIVLVTTDAENFHIVDITGALTPAFIRERIFTKLQISDEDQSKFSIYRTEINQFAIGDALTDEELFALYKDRGDSSGTLKLLVSHSSAYVHEPLYDPAPTSTVNTIPPPVLPQGILCEPLRPNRKGRIRQGSQSSASEPHHAEVGYEASVSDDLDHGDIDPGPRDVRDYSRTAIHARALPTPTQRPSSPAGYHRSRSPGHMLSPERAAVHSPESRTYRPSPYHDIGASPMPGTSPQTSRFDGMPPLPSLPPRHSSPSPKRRPNVRGAIPMMASHRAIPIVSGVMSRSEKRGTKRVSGNGENARVARTVDIPEVLIKSRLTQDQGAMCGPSCLQTYHPVVTRRIVRRLLKKGGLLLVSLSLHPRALIRSLSALAPVVVQGKHLDGRRTSWYLVTGPSTGNTRWVPLRSWRLNLLLQLRLRASCVTVRRA